MTEPLPLSPESLEAAARPLEKAGTLPAEAYTSPAVYALERRHLFEGGWLCAGRVDQVPERGDFAPLDLLGDRLMLVHGSDGEIRVLSRVCRHRGAELVGEPGNTRVFQCPYHAWTYDLTGRLRGAPLIDRDDPALHDCRLPEVRSEVWLGWVFVNLDGHAAALGPQLEPLEEALAPFGISEMTAVHTATYPSPFNWKVLVDNFMEAYHHIATHRDTLEGVFPAARSEVPDNHGPYSLLRMPAKEEGVDPLLAAVVYPFHLFAPGKHGTAWYQLFPLDAEHFELRIYTCATRAQWEDPATAEALTGMQALVRTVHEQDIGACEAVQAGMQAASFEVGTLARFEKAIWQFNQWWLGRWSGPSASGR
ncbi:MAG: aromatic ring-hydroxylating dioxygenase subunit alpha [Myxococcota bacterium]